MRRPDYYSHMGKFRYPFYILIHPVDGFRELKVNDKFSLLFANIVLAFWVLLGVLDWGYVDFDFKVTYRQLKGEVNIFQVLLTTVAIFAVCIVANWCFCTLMDGKGKAKEIWVAGAYAMMPYILCGLIRVCLTHMMVENEAVYLTYLNTIGLLWSTLLMFIAVMSIHDYSGPKAILSIGLTVLGALFMAFLAVLISGLVSQIYSFFATVYYEIQMRL